MERPGRTASRTGLTRRRVLSGAVLATSALAGCLTGDDEEETDSTPPADRNEELNLNGTWLTRSLPVQLFDTETDELVAELHYHGEFSHWHLDPLIIPLDGSTSVSVQVYDEDLEQLPLGLEETYRVTIRPSEETPEDLFDVDVTRDVVTFFGLSADDGAIRIELVENESDDVVFSPLELHIRVE